MEPSKYYYQTTQVMILYMLAIINVLLVLDLLRRVGPFAVATVSAGIFCCSLVYYGLTDAKYTDLIGIRTIAEARESARNELPVELIYSLGTLLTWCSAFGIQKDANADLTQLESQRAIVDSWISQRRITAVALVLMLVCGIDAVHKVLDPFPSSFTLLFYKLAGMLCVLASASIVLCWSRRHWGVVALLFPSACYTAAFQLAQYSRHLVLIAGVATALAMELRARQRKPRLSLLTITGLAITCVLFFFALQGRVDRPKGYDWAVIGQHLISVDLSPEAVSYGVKDVLFGPADLAGAMDMRDVKYDLQYQARSLSPLPAALDGFDPNNGTINLQTWTPFSAISEAFYFDWPFKIGFIIIYMLSIRQLTKLYCQHDEVFALLLSGPGIISCVTLHEYPIRNSLRLLIYSAVIAYFCARYMDWRSAAASRPKTGPAGNVAVA